MVFGFLIMYSVLCLSCLCCGVVLCFMLFFKKMLFSFMLFIFVSLFQGLCLPLLVLESGSSFCETEGDVGCMFGTGWFFSWGAVLLPLCSVLSPTETDIYKQNLVVSEQHRWLASAINLCNGDRRRLLVFIPQEICQDLEGSFSPCLSERCKKHGLVKEICKWLR